MTTFKCSVCKKNLTLFREIKGNPMCAECYKDFISKFPKRDKLCISCNKEKKIVWSDEVYVNFKKVNLCKKCCEVLK